MLLDLYALSPREWETYRDLGQCFDPRDALAQAERTLDALGGAVLVGMRRQDFLHEDEETLRAARDQLAFLLRGGDPLSEPDSVPVLAGIVITIAREAEKAAKEHAGAAYGKSRDMADLIIIAHPFMITAKPREGFVPAPREVSSMEAMAAAGAALARRRGALRELRRARQRAKHEPTPSRVVGRKGAPYRDAPGGRGAAPREGRFRISGHEEVRRAWENYRDICESEARDHAVVDEALTAEDAERLAKKEAELRVGPAISIPEGMFAAARKRAAEAEARREGQVRDPAPVGRRWHAPVLTLADAQGSYDVGYAWLVRAAREIPTESAVDAMALRLSDLLEEVALAGLRRTRKARGSEEMDTLVGEWPAGLVKSFLSSHRPSPAARRRLDEGIALVDEVLGTGVRFLGYNGSTDFDCIDVVTDDYRALLRFL